MSYTDRRGRSAGGRNASARARRNARLRRKRRAAIRRMLFLFIVLCAAAGGLIYKKCHAQEKTLVAQYEASAYNKSIYRGELYSEGLCVASGNIDMEGAPKSDGITSAALFDVENCTTDFAYNIYEKVYPASITKLMTALVALERSDLNETVTVSANADSRGFAWDEQTCGIREGDQFTMEQLLYGLLIYSGNDNAVAIAEHVGGSISGFAEMMNAKAKEIMATGSHFVNPNGLHDENHYTTAYDIYLIFNECLKYDKFQEIIRYDSTYKVSVKGTDGKTRTLEWEPTNLYAMGEASLPKKNRIIGGKTGTTLKAGNCLILLDESETGKPFISIVMGAETKKLLYQDMTALIESIPEKGQN